MLLPGSRLRRLDGSRLVALPFGRLGLSIVGSVMSGGTLSSLVKSMFMLCLCCVYVVFMLCL